MEERLKVPMGWPEGVPLPSLEEVEQAVQDAEKMMEETLNEIKTKLRGTSPEMFNAQIII